jgi:hypothetical protein
MENKKKIDLTDETVLRQLKSMVGVLIELMPDYVEQKLQEKKHKNTPSNKILIDTQNYIL